MKVVGTHSDNQDSEEQQGNALHVFARHLQKDRYVKLEASVVGHPNNGEMVPPTPTDAIYSSPKTDGSIIETFDLLFMETTNITYTH
jgi:hypothetical protein